MKPLMQIRQTGFTLIELVVMFLIIGIIAGGAVISYTPLPFKETREALQKLQDEMTHAQETAMLSGTPKGILFFDDRYMFLQIQGRSWKKSGEGEQLIDLSNGRLVVNNVDVRLPIFGESDSFFPQVVFQPTAEATEFILEVSRNDPEISASVLFELKTDILGRTKLEEFRSNF